jgi:hypothetical protein
VPPGRSPLLRSATVIAEEARLKEKTSVREGRGVRQKKGRRSLRDEGSA